MAILGSVTVFSRRSVFKIMSASVRPRWDSAHSVPGVKNWRCGSSITTDVMIVAADRVGRLSSLSQRALACPQPGVVSFIGFSAAQH